MTEQTSPADANEGGGLGVADLFELVVAILLGIGAIGGAWAGYQSGLWAGNCSTAYGGAAKLSTQASTIYQHGVMIANRDSALDLQAKQLILEAATSQDELTRLKAFGVAKYLYGRLMSKAGYTALNLPPEYHGAPDEKLEKMPDKALTDSLDSELGEPYYDAAVADGNAMFALADRKFEFGRQANGHGDEYSFATVLYAIALFFAGLALVFKSKFRWGFLGFGGIMLVASLGYTLSLPSAADATEPGPDTASASSAAATSE